MCIGACIAELRNVIHTRISLTRNAERVIAANRAWDEFTGFNPNYGRHHKGPKVTLKERARIEKRIEGKRLMYKITSVTKKYIKRMLPDIFSGGTHVAFPIQYEKKEGIDAAKKN